MKKCIAYIFLLIFSMQVLPVKEIGKILYKGLLTEERSELDMSEDECPSPKLKKDADPFHSEMYPLAEVQLNSAMINLAIHTSENVPKHHVGDIVTPPPNSCFA